MISINTKFSKYYPDAFVNLIPGEILYGNFNGIVNHTDSTAVCIAYRG